MHFDVWLDKRMIPEPNSGCWIWLGATSEGYGSISPKKYGEPNAHRYVYTQLKGPIPDGLELDHLCRVRCCVNPDHLEPVTRQVNAQRGQGSKLKCVNGHVYLDVGFRIHAKRGYRICKECYRKYRLNYKARRGMK